MLYVIDDALDNNNRIVVRDYFLSLGGSTGSTWADGSFSDLVTYGSPLSNLLRIIGNLVGLQTMVGCEYWSHVNRKSGWHKDTDEYLLYSKGVESFPLCASVYYPEVVNLKGGGLVFETMQVTPITNRLVIFNPSLLHMVDEFSGDRLSVAVNPWHYKPEHP